jgi:hypothetical protein
VSTTYAKAKAQYDAKSDETEQRSHACFAEGCPMAAALSDGSGHRRWCSYHHGINAEDIPRVTSVLNQHHDLRDVINHARRLACRSDMAHHALRAEWQKLRELLMFAGYEDPKEHSITQWIYACERMLASHMFAMLKTTGPRSEGLKP